MLLDLSGLHITESSAKPQGSEIGVRAHDAAHTELLAFLFLTPGDPTQTATTCLQKEIAHLKVGPKGPIRFEQKDNPQGTDTPTAATTLITYPTGSQYLYKFSGAAGQCLSVEVYADKGTNLDLPQAYALLARQSYDPAHIPDGSDRYTYASILYRSKQYAAAIPAYAEFLSTLPNDKQYLTSRRVATDNMGMALGMTGRVDEARQVFLDAIRKDPRYPLFYYNLACADAEQGNVRDARTHLQQAFDRRANVIPGESMPDPTKDDSILKLRDNAAFWAFVQSLSKN